MWQPISGVVLSLVLGATSLLAQQPTGTLVDIGGQRLHVYCTGRGTPTVVLESGAGDVSAIWSKVQPRVATSTRVCSYDRGGYAWSEPGAMPRSFAQLALELHTALERAGVPGPYVLVGQSYGGLVVRGFARDYPTDVAGMVLVDAVHEDQRVVYGGQAHRIRDAAKGRPFPAPHIQRDTAMLRRAALAPPVPAESLDYPLTLLSAPDQATWHWASARPLLGMAQAAEMDWSPEELARMHTERIGNRATLGNMPLIVLARTDGGYGDGLGIPADSLERERRALMNDLAHLSSAGRLVFAAHSGHNIHLEDPDLVVQAIRSVLEQVRRPTTKPHAG